MLRFLYLLTFAAIVLGQNVAPPKFNVTSKVTGGITVGAYSWPWQVSLRIQCGLCNSHVCGGVLIKRQWVLTATQCVDRNDIALVRLTSDAILNSYVQLAPLPPSGQVLSANTFCYVTGWGVTYNGCSLSALLRQAYLPIVDYATCSSSTWWGSTVKSTMICAGGSTNADCAGDGGGSLNCYIGSSYVVQGPVSFVSASGCDTIRKPTVFTCICVYLPWVQASSATLNPKEFCK